MKRLMKVFALALFFMPGLARAYPEFVRNGYFACSSCHVSPGGGGVLNEYGRSYSAEKLSAWNYEGEEKLLHGAIGDLPESLIIGGDFRQIQTYVDSQRSESGRWIPMQRDLDACVKFGNSTTCGTWGIIRQAEESSDGHMKFGLRKAMTKYDINENFSVRAGRFFERYGLMIADHTRSIRRGLGFEQGRETDQLEIDYTSEKFDIAISRDFGHAVKLGGETDEEQESFTKGWVGTLATFLGEKTRVGGSYRYNDAKGSVSQTAGIFVASGLGQSSFVLAEVDQQRTELDEAVPGVEKISRKVMSYVRLGTEVYKGVIPYLQQEVAMQDIRDGKTRQDTYGAGLQFFPRPHFEIDAFWGHVLIRQDMSYASAGYLLLHYYL